MLKQLYIILTVFLLFSCGQHVEKEENETIKKGNVTTTTSKDTIKLAKLINIKIYKPTHVKFKYSFVDNSGQDKRITVPGPSDNYLEALLYFDPSTFKEIKTKYLIGNDSSTKYSRQHFNFEWLDENVKDELSKSDTNYYGTPDYFFGLGAFGKLWLLDNKLLIIKSPN